MSELHLRSVPNGRHWIEKAVDTVAMMLRAVEAGEWAPEDTDNGDVAKAIARKAVELTELERRFDEGLI